MALSHVQYSTLQYNPSGGHSVSVEVTSDIFLVTLAGSASGVSEIEKLLEWHPPGFYVTAKMKIA